MHSLAKNPSHRPNANIIVVYLIENKMAMQQPTTNNQIGSQELELRVGGNR